MTQEGREGGMQRKKGLTTAMTMMSSVYSDFLFPTSQKCLMLCRHTQTHRECKSCVAQALRVAPFAVVGAVLNVVAVAHADSKPERCACQPMSPHSPKNKRD